MDGTFNIAPPLFTQVYSIHADFLARSHPLVFSLLTNKRQATYCALLNELSNIGNYVFQPQTMMKDFEMASIQAVDEVFPNASKTGCFFHLTQNIHRRIQNAGL